MGFWLLPLRYLWWHYTLALRDGFNITLNFVWFIYHFFSLPVLLRTLLLPWRRLGEEYGRGFDPAAFLGTLLVNVLMRLVGLILRLALFAVGAAVLLIAVFVSLLAFAFWLVLPAAVPLLLLVGFYLIFQ